MLAVVFLLLFVFSYSEDITFAVLDATGHDHVVGWIIGLVGLDVAVLTVAGRLKLFITRVDGDPPRLWRWWWSAFAAVVVLDVVLCLLPEDHSLWIDLFASVAFAGIMGILMAVSLNADPVTLFSRSRRSEAPRDWARVRATVPLMVGTFACYIAATAFDDFFDLDTVRSLDPELAAEVAAMPLAEQLGAYATLCEGAVSPAFFQQVVAVIPLLLLTLGVEFNFFRRDPVRARPAGCGRGDGQRYVDRPGTGGLDAAVGWLGLRKRPWLLARVSDLCRLRSGCNHRTRNAHLATCVHYARPTNFRWSER